MCTMTSKARISDEKHTRPTHKPQPLPDPRTMGGVCVWMDQERERADQHKEHQGAHGLVCEAASVDLVGYGFVCVYGSFHKLMSLTFTNVKGENELLALHGVGALPAEARIRMRLSVDAL